MIIGILVLAFIIWMAWEVWRAPMVKEEDNGNITVITGPKKLRELFKRK